MAHKKNPAKRHNYHDNYTNFTGFYLLLIMWKHNLANKAVLNMNFSSILNILNRWTWPQHRGPFEPCRDNDF